MKILNKKELINKCTCEKCKCEFEYEYKDITIEYLFLTRYRYIECPNCKALIYFKKGENK